MKKVHYLSGIVISIFVFVHLSNHALSIFGPTRHIEFMHFLRIFYRNVLVETILLVAVVVQIFSGLKLVKVFKKTPLLFFQKIPIWSGIYLAIFLIIHVSAILVGRLVLKLDTNFYFGVAGLNSFPINLFFIPYYALAIISFFGHIAGIHFQKMKHTVFGFTVINQSKVILLFGIFLTIVILYGLTNHFQGVQIPEAYHVLIGK